MIGYSYKESSKKELNLGKRIIYYVEFILFYLAYFMYNSYFIMRYDGRV